MEFHAIALIKRFRDRSEWLVSDIQAQTLKRVTMAPKATARDVADTIHSELRLIANERSHKRWLTYWGRMISNG